MAIKQIAWNKGTGSITVDYNGHGDGIVTVSSDNNNLYEERSQKITIKTIDGSKSVELTVKQQARVKIDISDAIVTASTQTYDGSAKTPVPTVSLNGNVIASSNYDIVYSNNTNAGNATITITGKGDYTGTATGTFTINKASGSVTSAPIAISNTYSGGSKYLVTTGSGTGTIYYRYKLSTSSSWSSWSTARPSVINAGTYNIEYYAAESTNYNQSSTGSLNSSVAKANRTLAFNSPVTVVTKNSAVTNIATPSAGSGDGTITYSSSSTSLATVNSSGVVTGKSDGNVIITATISAGTNYNSASASYTIAVIQYNSNGLIFYLDGINKGTDSNYWTDLIGGLQFAYDNCTKGTNCVTFNGTGVTKTLCSKTFPQTSCTIEVVCDYCAQPSFVMFAPHKGDVLAGFSAPGNGIALFYWASNSAHMNYCCDTDKFYAGNNDMTVCNGKTIRQQGTDSWGAQIDGYMKLGGRGTDRFYIGNVYAIRIYNRKLTKSEIVTNQTIDNQRFGFDIPLTQDYISSGLAFRLDGINKGNTSGSWTDLVGNLKFPLTNATAGSNYVEFNGTGSIQAESSTTLSQDSCTIEVNGDISNGVILLPSSLGGIAAIISSDKKYFCYGTKSAPRYRIDSSNKYISANTDNGVHDLYVASKETNDSWTQQIDGKIKIGGRNTDYFYTGKIYAIRIYNRKLSIIEMRHNQRRDIERFELGLT